LNPQLERVASDPARAAILLDFDGTLSDIVARPDLARPVAGAREALAALTGRYGMVAVISGRATEEVAALLDVPGVRYAGYYGAGGRGERVSDVVRDAVTAAVARVPGAWVEDKGSSLAAHYRQAPEPSAAREALLGPLGPVARQHGLDVLEGKKVLELVPRDRPRKGDAVQRLAREHGARAVLFAGDDLADLEAFDALDRMRDEGARTVKVAVRGREAWPELLEAADLVVNSPAGLVELLRDLAASEHSP
jgi:trehalose 6-phosphate phosphatase